MKDLIVGYGIQGKKRAKFLKKNNFYIFDPFNKNSNFKKLHQIPTYNISKVYLCIPDTLKINYLRYFIEKGCNVLVEKPLISKKKNEIEKIYKIANKKNKIFYTAYNHRFEPNLIELKKLLKKNSLGKIYSCRIYYGNGTAKLVKKSKWKDKGTGVIFDLGSHLIDMCLFLFENYKTNFKLIQKNNFENNSYDHSIVHSNNTKIFYNLEMSLCSWKNTFQLDIFGSKGSAHIINLCKWGNSKLIIRKRKLPSGVPSEKIIIKKKGDLTWIKEKKFFENLIKKNETSFYKDIFISNQLFSLKV